LGPVTLKVWTKAIPIWQVLGATDVESRFEARHKSKSAPFIGRVPTRRGRCAAPAARDSKAKSMWIRSWQRAWRLMPSRAASVQIKMRSGSVTGSALKRRFSSSRRSVEVAPVSRRCGPPGQGRAALQQPPFKPAARVLVFREEEQAPVGPLTASRHILLTLRCSLYWPRTEIGECPL
jgi:hypothetical protein